MIERLASVNLPPWTGTPREAAEVWRFTKGASRLARYSLWSRPLGGEVRLEVEGSASSNPQPPDPAALSGVADACGEIEALARRLKAALDVETLAAPLSRSDT